MSIKSSTAHLSRPCNTYSFKEYREQSIAKLGKMLKTKYFANIPHFNIFIQDRPILIFHSNHMHVLLLKSTCIVKDWLVSHILQGGHSNIVLLVNQPPKWTLNGVISVGVFATLNGVTLCISNPKWRM